MNRSIAHLRLIKYLRSRANDEWNMSVSQIAKELLISKASVSILLGSQELKSCHIDDVATYIIHKDSENE